MSARAAFAPLLLLCLAACGTVRVNEVLLREPERAGARAPVVLYWMGKEPSEPFYDVAMLQAVGDGDKASTEPVLRALALRANELGCEALVRVEVQRGRTLAHGSGVCVRFVRAEPAE